MGYYTLAGFTVPPRHSLEALREAIEADVLKVTYLFPSLVTVRVSNNCTSRAWRCVRYESATHRWQGLAA